MSGLLPDLIRQLLGVHADAAAAAADNQFDHDIARRWREGEPGASIAHALGVPIERLSPAICALRRKLGEQAVPLRASPKPKSKRSPPHNRAAELIPCLCCKTPFRTWDRKQNRICPKCAAAHQREGSGIPDASLH